METKSDVDTPVNGTSDLSRMTGWSTRRYRESKRKKRSPENDFEKVPTKEYVLSGLRVNPTPYFNNRVSFESCLPITLIYLRGHRGLLPLCKDST